MSPPKTSHAGYRALSADDRIRVSKLAAILRVCDALERTHSRRVKDISVQETRSRLQLTLHGVADAAVERLALRGKGGLFHDIFGLEISLSEQH